MERPGYFSRIFLTCSFFFTLIASSSGQAIPSYTLSFVTAKVTDQKDQKDVVVIYSVSSKDSINFPPVFTIPPRCNIVSPFSKQPVMLNSNNMGVTFVGRDIGLKNPEYYELVKSKINLSQKEALLFLIFHLYNISYGKIEKMEMEVLMQETKSQKEKNKHNFSFEVTQ